MPIYNYKCNECGNEEERLVNVDVRDSQLCSKCITIMDRKPEFCKKWIRKDGFWSANNYMNQTKKDLQDALDENDLHQEYGDKLREREQKVGITNSDHNM